MRLALCCLFLAAGWGAAGCVPYHRFPVEPPPGILFTQYRAPLTTNVQHTPSGSDLVVAEEKTRYLLDIILTTLNFAWDDAAIGEIAKRHGIGEVAYADYEFFNVFGVYSEFTVRVYGTPAEGRP